MNTNEEEKLRRFVFERILNQDTRTKSINLFGRIDSTPAILLAEKTAFDIATAHLNEFPHCLNLPTVSLLDRNDVYHWFLASQSSAYGEVKLTLIHPATETHVRKYTHQRLRMVVETGKIYKELVRPYIDEKRLNGRLNWVYNILEHNAEQDRIILEDPDEKRGFILLPDLKWDRKTAASMYIMALVHRRDISSIRDLKKRDVSWLRYLKKRIPEAICLNYSDIEEDQLKLYVHYQPSYYHFHIHAVSITHDGGLGQAAGKAILLGNLISWLESLGGGEEAGLDGVELTYFLGEESELFQNVFKRARSGNDGETEAEGSIG